MNIYSILPISLLTLYFTLFQRRMQTSSSKSRESTLSTVSSETLRGLDLLAEMPERVVQLVEEMWREREKTG